MGAAGANSKRMPAELLPGVLVFPDAEEAARAAAGRFAACAAEAHAAREIFCVALVGGGTPRQLYRKFAEEPWRSQVDWRRVHFFWSDERAVPPGDPESNFGMAQREFLSRVAAPPENLHRMEAERPDAAAAARDYEAALRRWLPVNANGVPRFHLILLGIGHDGHTASLFPSSQALEEQSRWVVSTEVPGIGRRMTLTLPVLNAAQRVLFLVTGEKKAEILAHIVSDSSPPVPAQLVRPAEGERLFFVDAAAAGLLADSRSGATGRGEDG